MRAARVSSGRIVEIFSSDKSGLAGCLHPDLIQTLIDVADQAQAGDWLTPPPAPSPAELAAHAADRRWQVEIGGAPWQNGLIVATDRDSQTKLLAEMVAIGAGLRSDGRPWKFANGVRALSNAEMQAVIVTARTHVETAFGVEFTLVAAIAAGTVTTLEQIDAAAWPPNG